MKPQVLFIAIGSLFIGATSGKAVPVAVWSANVFTQTSSSTSPFWISQSQSTAGPNDISLSATGAVGDVVQASFTANSSVPSIRASVDVSDPGSASVASGSVESTLDYSFVINGPTPSVDVNILATGFASLFASNFGGGAAVFELSISGLGILGHAFITDSGPLTSSGTTVTGDSTMGFTADFSLDQDYSLLTGFVYNVHMRAGAHSGLGSAGGLTRVIAYVDPEFTIVGPNAGAYSIDFSAGIGNGQPASVPDSGTTYSMLIISAFAIAVLRRRIVQAE